LGGGVAIFPTSGNWSERWRFGSVKPGWYWASRAGTTLDKEDRQIVQIELHMGETTLWRIAQECDEEISDWKDFTPVACEESAEGEA